MEAIPSVSDLISSDKLALSHGRSWFFVRDSRRIESTKNATEKRRRTCTWTTRRGGNRVRCLERRCIWSGSEQFHESLVSFATFTPLSFLSPLLPFRRVFSRFTDLSHVPPIFPAFRLSFREFRDLLPRVPSLSLKFQRFFLRFPNVCHDFFGVAILCHVFVVIFEVWSSNRTRFSRISPNFHTIRPFSIRISIIFQRLARFSA